MALIGRDTERGIIDAFLDAGREGGGALLLHGEAGVGKTALWHEAIEVARRRGFAVTATRPTEAEARLPFVGLSDLLAEHRDRVGDLLPPPQRAALDASLMRAVPSDEPAHPLALPLAVLALLRVASEREPVALAIDDLPWLDESTASVLRFALRRLGGARVTLVAAERTSEAAPTPALLADLPADRITRIAVLPLGARAIEDLLADALGLRLAPTVARRVHRRSGGNPFYAIEIGRAHRLRGLDHLNDDVPLPPSLASLIRERLDALGPDARELVAHAAALSQPTAAQLEAALGPDRAQVGMAAAQDAGILVAHADPIRFSHPLLASEAYASLADAERRVLHRCLAGVVTEPEELARHLALAATGPDPQVASALDDAAARARARGAPDAAAQLSELAAQLTPRTELARARRLAAAGRDRLMAGDVGQARLLLEATLDDPIARRGIGRAHVLYQLAVVRQLMDDFAAAGELGSEALRHAADDAELGVRIRLLLAGIAFITGRGWAAGAKHAAGAMRSADALGDPRLLASTIGAQITWRHATGHGIDEALVARAAELEGATPGMRTLDLPAFDLMNVMVQEGRTDEARAHLHALLERAERDGDDSSLSFLLGTAALDDFADGRLADARERLDRALRLAETTEQRTALVHSTAIRARVEARAGAADVATEAATEAFRLMDDTGWRAGEWWLRVDLALLELGRGDPKGALALVAAALDPVSADPTGRRRWGIGVAVEALLALGRSDEALSALPVPTRRMIPARLGADLDRARGLVRITRGDVDGAQAAISAAEEAHRRIDDRWELARTLLAAGEIHRRARRRARARAALRESIALFSFLGARAWSARASDELTRIDAGHAPGELTATQRRVADLVAEGLTNRQVADRLFMSTHTVEAHLSAIYRSLGIRSRAQLRGAGGEQRAEIRDS